MNATGWLIVLALGMIMGAVGQATRAVIGLKKAKDEASASGKTLSDVFETSTFVVSLLFGAAAGAVAAATTISSDSNVSSSALLALAAAGYSGADFLEGVMAKFVPDQSSATELSRIGDHNFGLGAPNPAPAPGPLTPLEQPQAEVRPLPL